MMRTYFTGLAAIFVVVLAVLFLGTAGPVRSLPTAEAAEPNQVAAARDERNEKKQKPKPFGLEKRPYWTTSNFRGRPEPPPPYKSQRLFPKLNFKETTLIACAPGTKRMFVGERLGKIYSIPDDQNCEQADLFLDCATLVDRLSTDEKKPLAYDSLYGLEFDPDFVNNRYCYVCYVVRNRDRSKGQLADGTRVSRFKVTKTEPPTVDVDSETLIISWLQGGHNGGCVKFGPDGCLYISSGDGGNAFPPDGLNSGQDMTRLLSKIMRIDVRKPGKDRPYTIPADNPYVDLPKARGETWAYGLRNPWKMSFDRKTGDLWVGDVGWELWELVFRVSKGANYGWSLVEGRQPVHVERKRGPSPIVPPTIEISHVEGASITGGFVYRGKRLPELVGSYVFGDWETRRIWGIPADGEKLGERIELVEPTVRIVDFAEDAEGELYMLDHDDGSIHTFVRNDVPPSQQQFPRKLSETGLYKQVAKHQVAEGVVPFSINTQQWSDHAQTERFVAVPGKDSIKLHAKPKQVVGSMFSRQMEFPVDTVLVKTLSMDMVHGDPKTRKRIETQVLHFDSREWQGYTYEWNDEQTDATLVDKTGKTRSLQVVDPQAPGGKRTQTWSFSSRMECIRCHNPWSEYTLAFTIPQLNRTHNFGKVEDNQIRTYRHVGLFENVIEKPDASDPYLKIVPPKSEDEMPRFSDPYDSSLEVNDRARSYLHVNCGHCHRYNGGGSSFIYLQRDLPLKDVKALGVRPTQGTFGIHEAQIIAPGDPYRSVLYFRLAKVGSGHMPHLGAKIVDERAVSLVHDWIRQLPVRLDDVNKIEQLASLDEPTVLTREKEEAQRAIWLAAKQIGKKQGRALPNEADLAAGEVQTNEAAAWRASQRETQRTKIIEDLLSTPPKAIQLSMAMRQRQLPASIHQLALDAAMKRADLAIRDLFESLVPDEQRAQRLGDNINVAELLKVPGDIERGRQLFHESTTVQCRSCHKIKGQGIDLGPDLSEVGKKHDRAKILENVTQPSLNIDPKYALWLVETKAGTVITGLMVKQDDKEIILRDAKNQQHVFPVADVEGVFPQRKSLMPDQLFRDFTAQQVADLLAYLSSLK